MKGIRGILSKQATGKKVLILFCVTNLVYAIMLLVTIPETMNYSQGLKLLDMMPTGYDGDYVDALFSTLGENGRYIYLYHQLPLDMIYPFLFGVTYCLLVIFILNKMDRTDTFMFYFSFLPIIAGTADYLENIGIIIMLKNFPDISSLMPPLTNIFSLTKSISTSLFFMVLIILGVSYGIRTYYFRKNQGKSA